MAPHRETDPSQLAGAAGVGVDVYSVASMVKSEADPGAPRAEKVALAEVARNVAIARKVTPTFLLTRGGKYGRQKDRVLGKPRWASTAEAPGNAEIAIAREVLEGGSNITRGSTDFASPRTFRLDIAANPDDYKTYHSWEDYLSARTDEGFVAVAVAGVDSDRQTFFTKTPDWEPNDGTLPGGDTLFATLLPILLMAGILLAARYA